MHAKITQKPNGSFHISWDEKIRAFPTLQEGLQWLQKEKFAGDIDLKDDGKTVKKFASLDEALSAV